MIRILSMLFVLSLIPACATGTAGFLEPIPGSITYGGQPRTKLSRSPVGSTFGHTFRDDIGRVVDETYRIEPDRSLLLIDRRYRIEYY
jgi:hypothetical protein